VGCVHLVDDRDKWRAVGNTVMKFGFYKMRRISRRAEGLGLLAFQYGFCTLKVVLQFVGKVDKNQL
jgi:hypothetical protein